MGLKALFYKHTLNFSFDAGTSRGVLKNKDSYYIKLYRSENPEIFGLGEAGPLKGLSPDFGELAANKLQEIVQRINTETFDFEKEDLLDFPSVKFALETAYADLLNGGKRIIYANDFVLGNLPISINGLIWMGTKEFMHQQIVEKIKAGFTTIKLKIGAIDFEQELSLLKFIRTEFAHENLTLRVDANGAFSPETALEKLKRLSDYQLHSIEQPIKAGQEELMAQLCANTPVPIALDEEIIPNIRRKQMLLETIKPQFIILKPSLMGGMKGSIEWIKTAENLGIDWWMTSALEGNIGLNALAQFTAELNTTLPQGLGTGKLYTNNFDSPLEIEQGHLLYQPQKDWNLSYFS